ncbi:MAG: HAMP domain-containing histidine kinase [Phycisphaerales bacterium]|nr:HAMP domain-containing histidine kinase [Phycisphaerales bacterium]
MRLGIRAKLVVTLILSGLLPLLLLLGVILVTVIGQRTRGIGLALRIQANQQANHLSALLAEQVRFVELITALPQNVPTLQVANAAAPLSAEQIQRIEQRWPKMTESDEPLRSILNNPIALLWQSIQFEQPRYAETIVTDATGRLIAATNKTTDYYQADETWWRECYAGGAGKVVLMGVAFDESARSLNGDRGAVVWQLCLPIYTPGPPADRQVAGVLKVLINARWLGEQLQQSDSGDLTTRMWLSRASGEPVSFTSQPADLPKLPDPTVKLLHGSESGWTKMSHVPGHELMGFAIVPAPTDSAMVNFDWFVLVSTNRAAAMEPIYLLGVVILVGGIGFITLFFLLGWLIARREIVQPLLALGRGAKELERGNLAYRLPQPGTPQSAFREDELGSLANEFNRMAEELSRNVRQLKEADALKQQFIDLASHELRTPVTYIQGVTQLAQRQPGEHSPVLDKIAIRAARLNRIVENMFKLLQGAAVEIRLRLSTVDLRQLIELVRRELEPFLSERRQTCDVKIDPQTPAIQADAEKITDVLMNLLANAIRFSPDGSTVTISAAPANDGVEIVVSDTGPGIDPSDLAHLFEPFYTGSTTMAHHGSGDYAYQSRGIGLGLSVVKRFVEMHGGRVWAHSAPQNTRMHVVLPLRPER